MIYRENTMVVDDSVKLMGEVNEQILEDGYAARERNLHHLLQKKIGKLVGSKI